MQTHIGTVLEAVGYDEGVGFDFLEGRGQGVEAAAQRIEAACFHPTGKLSAYVVGINSTRQKKSGLEGRLISYYTKEMFEFHSDNIP